MQLPQRLTSLAFLAAIVAARPSAAGEQHPHIGYVYPAGGQQGTTVQVTVGGQYLGGASQALVTGTGVQASIVKYIRALSQGTLNALQDKLAEVAVFQRRHQAALEEGDTDLAGRLSLLAAQALEEFEFIAIKAGLDDPTPRGLAQLRSRLSDPRRQVNPQISEAVAVRVTIAPNAEPGERELRLRTPGGLTNPIFFHVGQCREYLETEPNDRTPDAEVMTETVADIEFPGLGSLPVTINGQIMPGDVDRFRFHIPKGTRLVAVVSARSLIPYLADAVPGWFQATLALYDAKGRELAFADDFRFHPDPIIYYEIKESGDYILEVRDSIYRGREDFVYRITVGQLPLVTTIFPLGARAGTKATFALEGWNLAADRLALDLTARKPGTITTAVPSGKFVSNAFNLALDSLPEHLEKEPNDAPAQAQAVELPAIINGRIDRPGDWDVFAIQGRAGDELAAEVTARRLGSPLDSVLKLTDASGKQLAANDDHEDRGAGFTTHHADSFLMAKLPADGAYYLFLGDTQDKGGTSYAYRLRISRPRPSFELRVVPSAVNARSGTNVPIAVYALRRDGFAGEISLALADAPKGFSLGGAWIPAGHESVRLTLGIPPDAPARAIPLRIEGRATINGAEFTAAAVPAEDMMQAFAYHHLVPSANGTLVLVGSRGTPPPLKLLAEGPARLEAGGDTPVRFSCPGPPFLEQVRLELDNPPKGIAIKAVKPEPPNLAVHISIDPKEAKPGLRGNLILTAFLETSVTGPDGQPQAGTRRTALGTIPAVPFEVVEPPPAAAAR